MGQKETVDLLDSKMPQWSHFIDLRLKNFFFLEKTPQFTNKLDGFLIN